MQNPGEMHFERRGREGFAEVAKENQKGFFCVFCVSFASSAFKMYFWI